MRDNARPHPGPLNTDFGRDIALRCPRPRSSGRHRCAAERGADGAARRPYQVRGRCGLGRATFGANLRKTAVALSLSLGERAGVRASVGFHCIASLRLPTRGA